jgi:hypothetical protein
LQQTELRADDIAFVVARPRFPHVDGASPADMAAAWPAGVLGINDLSAEAPQQPDFIVQAALAEQAQLNGGSGAGGGAYADEYAELYYDAHPSLAAAATGRAAPAGAAAGSAAEALQFAGALPAEARAPVAASERGSVIIVNTPGVVGAVVRPPTADGSNQ